MKKIILKLFLFTLAILSITTVTSTKLISAKCFSEEPPVIEEIQILDENHTQNQPEADENDVAEENFDTNDNSNQSENTTDSNVKYDSNANDVPAAKIIVFGCGKVTVKPDIAYISIGVETVNSNLQIAIKENNDNIIAIIDYLKSKNIEENDIITKYYSVYQSGDYTTSEKYQKYHISNTIEYKTTDLENIGSQITELTELGANRLDNIQFDCSDISNCYQKALKLALEDAKQKAASFTSAKLTIDKITEENFYTCIPYRSIDAYAKNAETVKSENIEIEAKIVVSFK